MINYNLTIFSFISNPQTVDYIRYNSQRIEKFKVYSQIFYLCPRADYPSIQRKKAFHNTFKRINHALNKFHRSNLFPMQCEHKSL